MNATSRQRNAIGFVAIWCATLAVYYPAFRGELIWNDPDYVTKPDLQGLGGLWRIWTEVGATQQYYPLLHSFFWLQHRLWGDSPTGHHVVSVLLHATAACLLALVVLRLLTPEGQSTARSDNPKPAGGPPPATIQLAAWLAAALFALHPVMVESVAWISEQKNTLSTVFYLWAALVYLRYQGDKTRPAFGSYAFASFLFVCALLSKSVTASLPAALLLSIWWKRGRVEKSDVVPLIPWFAAGIAVGLFTAYVERTYIGAQGAEFDLTLPQRFLLAGRVVWFYLGKLVWPADLIFIYPRWQVETSDWRQWIYPIGALGLFIALFAIRRRTRAPLAAYLFFVGTLFPTIGFFNVYAFRFSFVADHWQYLPSIGAFVLAGCAIAALVRGPTADDGRRRTEDGRLTADDRGRTADADYASKSVVRLPSSVVVGAIALLATLAAISWRQTHLYDNLENFYRRTLAKNPGVWMAHNNLGLMQAKAGNYQEAIGSFNAALRIKPDFPDAESNLGAAFLELHQPDEAITHLENAVRLAPAVVKARVNLGLALREKGRMPEAIAQFEEVVRLQPRAAEVFYELGAAYSKAGDAPKAITAFEGALRARPDFTEAGQRLVEEHMKAGAAMAAADRLDEAIRQFAEAVRLDPSHAPVHFNLGLALAQNGRMAEAVTEFRAAARIDPSDATTRTALAQALAESGQRQEAAVQAAEAQRLLRGGP